MKIGFRTPLCYGAATVANLAVASVLAAPVAAAETAPSQPLRRLRQHLGTGLHNQEPCLQADMDEFVSLIMGRLRHP